MTAFAQPLFAVLRDENPNIIRRSPRTTPVMQPSAGLKLWSLARRPFSEAEQIEKDRPSLLGLPSELWREICVRLSCDDLGYLAQTCLYFRHLLHNSSQVWKQVLCKNGSILALTLSALSPGSPSARSIDWKEACINERDAYDGSSKFVRRLSDQRAVEATTTSISTPAMKRVALSQLFENLNISPSPRKTAKRKKRLRRL